MEIVDIKFKHAGIFTESIIYRNIKDYSITIIEDMVIIKFTKIHKLDFFGIKKKEITRHYDFQFPKASFIGVCIRRTQYE